MQDPFEGSLEKNSPVSIETNSSFPDFNTQWLPPFEEGPHTKLGSTIEKGTHIAKKTFGFYMCGLGLIALISILPVLLRFMYEFSSWAFDKVGNIFP